MHVHACYLCYCVFAAINVYFVCLFCYIDEHKDNVQRIFDSIVNDVTTFGTVVISMEAGIGNIERLHGNYPCVPKVASFTHVEGRKLRRLNIKWANGLIEKPYIIKVEQCIAEFLDSEILFVFYRHGSFLGVDNDATRAIDVVCHEIGYHHYMLVVGDANGLEEQLEMDVKIVAHIAGLTDNDLQKLYDSHMHNGYGRCHTEKGVFTLLMVPKAEKLKCVLSTYIPQCSGISLTFIYSGHGEKGSGSWVLRGDDRFSGSDLLAVLKAVMPQHYLKIHILLNCCYGFGFAKDINCLNFLIGCLSLELSSQMTELKEILQSLITDYSDLDDNDTISKAIEIASDNEPEDDQLFSGWVKLNHFITLQIYSIVQQIQCRGFTGCVNYEVSIVPFSAGPLYATGILPELYPVIENYKAKLPSLSAPLRLLPREPVAQCLIDDPHLIVFPASNGDSTLFHWNDFNMLVDGGPLKDPPCFWETVHRLPMDQCLDVVVVTHYDDDHIVGILGLFEDVSIPIEIGTLYTMHPQDPAARFKSPRNGKSLYNLAHERLPRGLILEDLVANPNTPIITKQGLRIFMLTPSAIDKSRRTAANKMRLTSPNRASASLLIECQISEGGTTRYIYALLTGDTPGRKIIRGLQNVVAENATLAQHLRPNGYYNFKYIDMPHHGSKHNNPREFLAQIKTEVCVVSTNSRYYNHPDDETLKELKTALQGGRIQQLLFTYQKMREGNRNLADSFNERINKENRCRFAQNDPSTNGTRCWRFNLARATNVTNPQECDCGTALN